MCHHHDVVRVKLNAKDFIRNFVCKGWKGRSTESANGGKVSLSRKFSYIGILNVKEARTSEAVKKKSRYEDVWKTYFNGIFDA